MPKYILASLTDLEWNKSHISDKA